MDFRRALLASALSGAFLLPWPAAAFDINPVTPVVGGSDNWSPKLLSGLSTTVTAVKASSGQVGMIQCYNPNSSQVYIQIFDAATTGVTLGTTPPKLSIAIGATSTGGFILSAPGIGFSTAISVAATTTATGSTAPATAPDCNALYE